MQAVLDAIWAGLGVLFGVLIAILGVVLIISGIVMVLGFWPVALLIGGWILLASVVNAFSGPRS